ncbi:MAG: BMP family ABC transporter substrate-binding protein, partial [Kamptonema sp. SIO4C4]|nr:BMP family ABC transporter substrate-binding protein [Kamptonema sp. SIO4C4]
MSCRQSPNNPTEETSNVPSSFSVAMLLSGSHQDKSYSQGGYEGLKLIEQEYNAEVDYTEYVSDDESEAVLRQYAEDDYDLIIGHSGGYIESAEKVAAEFPRTKFALVTTYPGNNRNLGAVAFRSGEVGYLTGALAAMKTQTQKVAYLVGDDYPVYQEEAALFKRGVEATDADVEAFIEVLGTWTEGEKAIEVVTQLREQGVDIFAINADEAGVAAIEELKEEEGVYIIGWTKDQYE